MGPITVITEEPSFSFHAIKHVRVHFELFKANREAVLTSMELRELPESSRHCLIEGDLLLNVMLVPQSVNKFNL